ncbi:hypothetical protein T439DRAFT_321255, partial [Meredithblackwellia eburnea MCA 4105]
MFGAKVAKSPQTRFDLILWIIDWESIHFHYLQDITGETFNHAQAILSTLRSANMYLSLGFNPLLTYNISTCTDLANPSHLHLPTTLVTHTSCLNYNFTEPVELGPPIHRAGLPFGRGSLVFESEMLRKSEMEDEEGEKERLVVRISWTDERNTGRETAILGALLGLTYSTFSSVDRSRNAASESVDTGGLSDSNRALIPKVVCSFTLERLPTQASYHRQHLARQLEVVISSSPVASHLIEERDAGRVLRATIKVLDLLLDAYENCNGLLHRDISGGPPHRGRRPALD